MLTLLRLSQLAALPALILVVPILLVALSGRLQCLISLTARRRCHRGRRHRPTQGLPHHSPCRGGRFLRRRPAYRPGAAGLGPAARRLHHTLLRPALAGDRARPGPPSCRLPRHPLLPLSNRSPVACSTSHSRRRFDGSPPVPIGHVTPSEIMCKTCCPTRLLASQRGCLSVCMEWLPLKECWFASFHTSI